MAELSQQRELTYGEKAAGVGFNPSGNELVDQIKRQSADLINSLDKLRADSDNGEVKRMASVAITEAQTAQMWGVKAATWIH